MHPAGRLRIRPLFVQPDRQRNAFFDGMGEEFALLELRCGCCQSMNEVRVLDFVCSACDWFRGMSVAVQTQVLDFFDCKRSVWRGHPVIESHDEGEPYFGLVPCQVCRVQMLLYISFHERQPARYVARFQGAAVLET